MKVLNKFFVALTVAHSVAPTMVERIEKFARIERERQTRTEQELRDFEQQLQQEEQDRASREVPLDWLQDLAREQEEWQKQINEENAAFDLLEQSFASQVEVMMPQIRATQEENERKFLEHMRTLPPATTEEQTLIQVLELVFRLLEDAYHTCEKNCDTKVEQIKTEFKKQVVNIERQGMASLLEMVLIEQGKEEPDQDPQEIRTKFCEQVANLGQENKAHVLRMALIEKLSEKKDKDTEEARQKPHQAQEEMRAVKDIVRGLALKELKVKPSKV